MIVTNKTQVQRGFDPGLSGPNIVCSIDRKTVSYKGGHTLDFSMLYPGVNSGVAKVSFHVISLNEAYRTWFGVQTRRSPLTFSSAKCVTAMVGGGGGEFNTIVAGERNTSVFGSGPKLCPGDRVLLKLNMDTRSLKCKVVKSNGSSFSCTMTNLPNEELNFAVAIGQGGVIYLEESE